MKKLLTLLLSLTLFIPLSISAFAADDTTNTTILAEPTFAVLKSKNYVKKENIARRTGCKNASCGYRY